MDEIIYTEEDNLVFVKERNLKIEIGFFDLKKQAGASFKLTVLAELEDFKKMLDNTEKKIHNTINDNIFDSKEEEAEYERIMKDNVEEQNPVEIGDDKNV